MNRTLVNLACGDSYVEGWRNLDYVPHSKSVVRVDLLERLPISDCTADVVYSSHFLEHIPRERIDEFLAECFRITRHGGRIRLVLPDFEEMSRTYLSLRGECQHSKADFLVLEMLDQCVRTVPGGELGSFYQDLQTTATDTDMIEFVKFRTGHVIQAVSPKLTRLERILRNPALLVGQLEKLYVRTILALLPSAFKQQNVSLASVGERHAWIYDFHTVERVLGKAGFVDIQRLTASTSAIPNFPYCPLDIDAQGQPRKGAESMYVEARKA